MLTLDEFKGQHDVLAKHARNNFLRSGFLAAVLILTTPDHDQVMVVMGDPDMGPAEMDQVVQEHGMVAIPGDWRDNIPRLKSIVKGSGAVAASLISEIWVGTQQVAEDFMKMDIRVSDHPMKDEAITVISAFPAHNWHNGYIEKIVRERNGPGVRLEPMPMGFGDDSVQMVSWFVDILPAKV